MKIIIEIGEADNTGKIPVEIRYEPEPGDAKKQIKTLSFLGGSDVLLTAKLEYNPRGA